MDLNQYRKQIDVIDDELLRLFKERMDVALQIVGYKKEHGLPVFDSAREQEILTALCEKAERIGMEKDRIPYVGKLYSTIFEISRDYQSRNLDLGDSRPYSPSPKKKILVINGPNLNMLGIREPKIYGDKSYSDLVAFIRAVCVEENVDVECVQSNHEGGIVDVIQSAYGKFDGIVINPAAFTHTSVAILDALKAVGLPTVEVHLSDIHEREDFRKVSYISSVCVKTFVGMGFEGYAEAIRCLGAGSFVGH